MKSLFSARTKAFNADAINATIERALTRAGLNTSVGPMRHVTETIRRALASGRTSDSHSAASASASVDVEVEVERGRLRNPASSEQALKPGSFETHQFSNAAGSRAYKVYMPKAASATPRAMVVMLHGCTQTADDFAAGTQMNRLADTHGFLVLYPEQAAHANTSKCWNWFQPQDQLRGDGEPSLIAGITSKVASENGVDPLRIFVAGLSAGAAMAVVLGETYPDLFAGIGSHSGLPYGSAHDIPSAMVAMKGGRGGIAGLHSLGQAPVNMSRSATQSVPIIVFHGDRDHTVQQSNSHVIVQQARDAYGSEPSQDALHVGTRFGVAEGGRRFSREIHTDALGQARIENWTLHGAGHAWSGGHASGSYTDVAGPDASAEMVRFFLNLAGTRLA
ncbi:alpha/beta hydrolase family esterase [Paucibacter sp. Y2R2-4]|uniref:extracellular catalytic domain type 1 short-chain-length polyhydroxyalkanoate depolymerase n=1 Tax=Paucibacter sp. Y2R2-4 TaxID=2893553 RepID=UPI0021E45A4F|nr:PHB depolymerase family esterase [Paucibacter sp. Y2R2-4]MCV2351808.1 PHB depolymerase family esterase [Paucibacter sp. Y2R2-4]